MPSKSPRMNIQNKQTLRRIGESIRSHRKKMKISSVATAEASGLSRVTLYRIEQGEESVAMGAYLSVIAALGLMLEILNPQNKKQNPSQVKLKLPEKILVSQYKQLKRLAWQLKDSKKISLKDALALYERNWRHVDTSAMDQHEKDFLDSLLIMFGRERLLV